MSKNIDSDFILSLGKSSIAKSDKDLTLTEYLEKYNQMNKVIEKEKASRPVQSNDLEKLTRFIEDNEKRPLNESSQHSKKPLFISSQVENKISKEFSRKERQTLDQMESISDRKPVYANTKATITNDSKMGALRLEKFSSK